MTYPAELFEVSCRSGFSRDAFGFWDAMPKASSVSGLLHAF